ncbi:MAG TPA: 30S ribosomal protein S4 [Dehalococcoidia bacterium]|jgi:small subunit ribosomal protein S4
MARYTGPDCRVCRRHGEKLFLKGERCMGPKCAIERRNQPPGPRSTRRRKVSDRGLQLREKQKARFAYGVLEKQFRLYYAEAVRRPGVTGENLVRLLEQRLDNAVHRLGWADSRDQGRQIVRHGHITLNGRKTDIPSAQVKVGDVIGWTPSGRRTEYFKVREAMAQSTATPSWLTLERDQMIGRVTGVPARADADRTFDESVIVEYYSR